MASNEQSAAARRNSSTRHGAKTRGDVGLIQQSVQGATLDVSSVERQGIKEGREGREGNRKGSRRDGCSRNSPTKGTG